MAKVSKIDLIEMLRNTQDNEITESKISGIYRLDLYNTPIEEISAISVKGTTFIQRGNNLKGLLHKAVAYAMYRRKRRAYDTAVTGIDVLDAALKLNFHSLAIETAMGTIESYKSAEREFIHDSTRFTVVPEYIIDLINRSREGKVAVAGTLFELCNPKEN